MLQTFRPGLSKAESLAAAERMIEECRRLGRPLEFPEVRSVLGEWLSSDDGIRRVRALTVPIVEPID